MLLTNMNGSDSTDAPYWKALEEGRLALPRCQKCNHWQWPATSYCSQCGDQEFNWIEMPMEGTIFSWTRTWHRFGLTEALDLPFVSIVASVAGCGIRLLGRLEDPDQIDPVIGQEITGKPGHTMVESRQIPTIIWSRET